MGNKRKGKENVGLLLNGTGDLMAKDTEKAEVPSLPQSLPVSPAFRPLRPGGRLQQGILILTGGGSG